MLELMNVLQRLTAHQGAVLDMRFSEGGVFNQRKKKRCALWRCSQSESFIKH